jgi:branched-chain amino acid transport system permease protein
MPHGANSVLFYIKESVSTRTYRQFLPGMPKGRSFLPGNFCRPAVVEPCSFSLAFPPLSPLALASMDYFLQQLVNGATLGAVYGLIALGYTMVYGVLGMINFAHGDVFMVGAFIGFLLFSVLSSLLGIASIPLALFATFLLAMFFTAAYGVAVERIAYRPLRQAPRLAPFISAVGISIVLQNVVMLSQGARVKSLPPLLPGSVAFGNVTISYVQLLIFGTTLVLLAGFSVLVTRTTLGRSMRAVEQDATMTSLLGIDVNRTITVTFAIGAALAAVAGLMYALYYGVMEFTMGYMVGIKAFAAAVLGGIGSLPGAILGGFILGLIEALWSSLAYVLEAMQEKWPTFSDNIAFVRPFFSESYKHLAAFLVLIAVLMVRPVGLLGRPTVEKV